MGSPQLVTQFGPEKGIDIFYVEQNLELLVLMLRACITYVGKKIT